MKFIYSLLLQLIHDLRTCTNVILFFHLARHKTGDLGESLHFITLYMG
jgi:hypothetical protein